jgi:hypothetical protein
MQCLALIDRQQGMQIAVGLLPQQIVQQFTTSIMCHPAAVSLQQSVPTTKCHLMVAGQQACTRVWCHSSMFSVAATLV